MKKLYNEERDTDDYDNLVMKHMMAMTTEGLHSKAAIAIELAYRDWQIEQLREALCRCQGWVKAYGEPETKAIVCKALEQTK